MISFISGRGGRDVPTLGSFLDLEARVRELTERLIRAETKLEYRMSGLENDLAKLRKRFAEHTGANETLASWFAGSPFESLAGDKHQHEEIDQKLSALASAVGVEFVYEAAWEAKYVARKGRAKKGAKK